MFSIRQINPAIRLALLDLKALSEKFPGLKQRDLEKKGTQVLLDALFKENKAELRYDNNNKPHIANYPGHISISHSHDRLAIIHDLDARTGIDIELLRDKVKAIQHKFLNTHEQAMAEGHTETLVSFWAAKETLYKIHGTKGLDFKKNLFIEEINANTILAGIQTEQTNQKFLLKKEKLGDYILVYAEKEV